MRCSWTHHATAFPAAGGRIQHTVASFTDTPTSVSPHRPHKPACRCGDRAIRTLGCTRAPLNALLARACIWACMLVTGRVEPSQAQQHNKVGPAMLWCPPSQRRQLPGCRREGPGWAQRSGGAPVPLMIFELAHTRHVPDRSCWFRPVTRSDHACDSLPAGRGRPAAALPGCLDPGHAIPAAPASVRGRRWPAGGRDLARDAHAAAMRPRAAPGWRPRAPPPADQQPLGHHP